MNFEALNKDLLEIIKIKNELSKISYDNEKYDEIEEQLHDLEDSFSENHGDYLEDVLHDVHDELCPDNDVLLPIAYLANNYIDNGVSESGAPIYDVMPNEGVPVEVDDFPGKETRLVFLPSPTRLVLQIGKEQREEVWRSEG